MARKLATALEALQHRGQESAGIATADGRKARLHKEMGRVGQVFTEATLAPLRGHLGVGHDRYSTTGDSARRNAQPHLLETAHGPLAVAHNGHLTRAPEPWDDLAARDGSAAPSTDSALIARTLARTAGAGDGEPDWVGRLQRFMARAEGGYALVVLTRDAVYAARDPHGLRPLCLGELRGSDGRVRGHAAVSESAALAPIEATHLREVAPGEIVRLDADGLHAVQAVPPARPTARCAFEHVYFARPDSVVDGRSVQRVREALGARLAREAPAEADVVVGVPDSATPAATGYARGTGLPVAEGLLKNRRVGRTFIEPSDPLRRSAVQLKYAPLPDRVAGRRVVLVDDSLVRGHTAGPLVQLLRDAGAREVHLRIASPPIRHPCHMGVDMGTHDALLARGRDAEALRVRLGADSLAQLSLDGLREVIDGGGRALGGRCTACFSGVYPVPIDERVPGTARIGPAGDGDRPPDGLRREEPG